MQGKWLELNAQWVALLGLALSDSMIVGCARMPYTTQTVHEDEQVVVTLQREVEPRGYTHPILVTAAELAGILKGFSIREPQRVPLRWFAEETPPKPLLRDDEIRQLAPNLSKALEKASPDERVHFQARTPQLTGYDRLVIEGWLAVRDPYLYFTIEQFQTPIPIRQSDLYDRNYPTTPPPPREYILYFEPGRFWTTDGKGNRAVEFRQFLRSGEAGATRVPQLPSVGAP